MSYLTTVRGTGLLKIACEAFTKKLCDTTATPQQRQLLEIETRGQHENRKWRETRNNYLTASNFGAVVKRRKQTPCHNLVKKLLYAKEVNTAAVTYGRINEKVAIEKYCVTRGVTVDTCGMFVDVHCPYLAASPDGCIKEEDGPCGS